MSSAFGILGNFTRRAPLVAYWQQNFTLSLISDTKSVLPKNGLQPAILQCKFFFWVFAYKRMKHNAKDRHSHEPCAFS